MATNLEVMNMMSDVAVANSTEDHKKNVAPRHKKVVVRRRGGKSDVGYVLLVDSDDRKVLQNFKSKISSENGIRRKHGLPIARYDVLRKKLIGFTRTEKKITMTPRPNLTVYAGPNGSGKSTITPKFHEDFYVNADDIKKTKNVTDLKAAQMAEELRELCLQQGRSFSFETVLSTERNLNLMRRAKLKGYFIRGFFILTCSANLNVLRVKSRVALGGHDVPEEKFDQDIKNH